MLGLRAPEFKMYIVFRAVGFQGSGCIKYSTSWGPSSCGNYEEIAGVRGGFYVNHFEPFADGYIEGVF